MRWMNSRDIACMLGLALIALSVSSCGAPPRIGRLTVLVSGNAEGTLRTCGCSADQAGGEARMASIVKLQREDALKPQPADHGYPPGVLLINTGNFSNAESAVTRVESAGVVRSMSKLSYGAVGLGLHELSYSQQDLLDLLGHAGLPLSAANLRFVKPKTGRNHSAALNKLLKPYRLIRQPNGYTVGVINLIDLSFQDQLDKLDGFKLSDPFQAASKVISAHGKEAAIWILSVANAREDQASQDRLASVPGITLLIGFSREPAPDSAQPQAPHLPHCIAAPFARTIAILSAIVAYSPEGKVEAINSGYQMVASSTKPDAAVQQIVEDVKPQLEQIAFRSAMIGNQSGAHPRYVGQSVCAQCHTRCSDMLAVSKHRKAYETLRAKGEERSAACLPCHVTGYNQAGGWNIRKDAERIEMRGIHCESCHGPGEYHVAVQSGDKAPLALARGGRNKFGLQTAGESTCVVCHDKTRSPNFNFDDWWREIVHFDNRQSKK